MNFYTHSKDTPAGELHGSCEVFLQATQEVGTAENGLEDAGQSLPPLFIAVFLHYSL